MSLSHIMFVMLYMTVGCVAHTSNRRNSKVIDTKTTAELHKEKPLKFKNKLQHPPMPMLRDDKIALPRSRHYDNAGRPGSIVRPRVIDGVPDDENMYPFVVNLQSYWTKQTSDNLFVSLMPEGHFRVCSGSVIAENWVLTAAHCLGNVSVRYGDMTVPFNVTNTRKVLKQFIHPNYQTDAGVNDIALLLIAKIPVAPGRLSAVEPESMLGLQVQYAGYGTTFIWHNNIKEFRELISLDQTRHLQIGEAVVNKCDRDNSGKKTVFCLVPKCSKPNQVPFMGDSGGPLLYNGKIAGVAQSGDLKGSPASVSWFAYTPVTPYLYWINTVMSTHTAN